MRQINRHGANGGQPSRPTIRTNDRDRCVFPEKRFSSDGILHGNFFSVYAASGIPCHHLCHHRLSSANEFAAGKGSVIAHALIGLIFSILVLAIWGFVVFAFIIP